MILIYVVLKSTLQCRHEDTPYEDWPKKFQWVTETYWATSDDDNDQEPAASKYLDPDDIAVYHLGECTFQGCRWTKLHRDCERLLCNFHCRATGNCSVACHRAGQTMSSSQSGEVSRSLSPATYKHPTPSTSSSASKPPTLSIPSTHPIPPAPRAYVSRQRPLVTPPVRTEDTSNLPFDLPPVDLHARPLKKRKEEWQATSELVKRRRIGVIDLTRGSSQDNPIDLDAE